MALAKLKLPIVQAFLLLAAYLSILMTIVEGHAWCRNALQAIPSSATTVCVYYQLRTVLSILTLFKILHTVTVFRI